MHNLSHAIFESGSSLGSPYELSGEERRDLNRDITPSNWTVSLTPRSWAEEYNLMGINQSRPGVYPTTRSMQLGKIEYLDYREAFHELFAQWVVKKKVILNPRNPRAEKELETNFRNRIDYLVWKGAVVYNV